MRVHVKSVDLRLGDGGNAARGGRWRAEVSGRDLARRKLLPTGREKCPRGMRV